MCVGGARGVPSGHRAKGGVEQQADRRRWAPECEAAHPGPRLATAWVAMALSDALDRGPAAKHDCKGALFL